MGARSRGVGNKRQKGGEREQPVRSLQPVLEVTAVEHENPRGSVIFRDNPLTPPPLP